MDDNKMKSLAECEKELSTLLKQISSSYQNAGDEFENELFYSGLHKAKEFSANLRIILKHRGEIE